MSESAVRLIWPTEEYLSAYADALRQEWSPDNVRPEAAWEELEAIEKNPSEFIARQVDREGKGPPVRLPDGSTIKRLPGYRRWIWDGEFCGVIGFRWQPGTNDLPPFVLGHIGFAVVPWKQRRGYATRALGFLLPAARQEGIDYVELTTSIANVASQRVIEANGGKLVERFEKPAAYGCEEGFRYRIHIG
jgi:predicted acetyltransferase